MNWRVTTKARVAESEGGSLLPSCQASLYTCPRGRHPPNGSPLLLFTLRLLTLNSSYLLIVSYFHKAPLFPPRTTEDGRLYISPFLGENLFRCLTPTVRARFPSLFSAGQDRKLRISRVVDRKILNTHENTQKVVVPKSKFPIVISTSPSYHLPFASVPFLFPAFFGFRFWERPAHSHAHFLACCFILLREARPSRRPSFLAPSSFSLLTNC